MRLRPALAVVGLLGTLALITRPASAVDYYVATNGSNSNPGTLAKPFRTIQQAANVATAGSTVYVRGGTYRETVSMSRSGAAGLPITFQPYANEQVTVTGLDVVGGGWSKYSGSIYSATVNSASQVFANGKLMTEARWPNSSVNNPLHAVYATIDSASIYDAPAVSTITDAALPGNAYWTGGKVAFIPGREYVAGSDSISSHNGTTLGFQRIPEYPGSVGTEGWAQPAAGQRYYVYGKLDGLDASKEYYYDSAGKKLYLYAPGGAKPEDKAVETRSRTYGFDLGSQSYVNVRGFQLKAAAVNVAGDHNEIDNVQILYPGAFADASDYQPSLYATPGVALTGQYNTVKRSEIAYAWGSGVAIKGANNTVDNNVIHDTNWSATEAAPVSTYVETPVSPFEGGQPVVNATITNNTIYNTARSGVVHYKATNALIAHNEIARYGYLTKDTGGTYTYLQDAGGTVVAYNYVHDSRATEIGSGLYGDEVSNITYHHNLVADIPYDGHGAILHTYAGGSSQFYNNTLWNISGLAMVGSVRTGAVVSTKNNLSNKDNWVGTSVSNNITTTSNPFVNSAAGDYTLRSGTAPVDAGTPIPGITDGYVGPAPDVGAFESGAAAIQVDLDSDAGLLYFGDGPAQVVDGHGELGMTWLTGSGNGGGGATLISGPPDIVLETGNGATNAASIAWGSLVDHTHASSGVAFYQNSLFQSAAWSVNPTLGARVSGLAAGNYRVYAIAVRPDDLSATFDVGIGINAALTTQTAGGIGAGDPAETAWVAGKNYVYSDVTVGSTSDFITIASTATNLTFRGHLQGFQIVSGATPWTAGASFQTWLFGNQAAAPLASAAVVTAQGGKTTTGSLIAGRTGADASTNKRSFFKFDLSGITGPIESAVLRIYENTSPAAASEIATLHQVLSNWDSSNINYNVSVGAGMSFYDPDNLDLYTDVDVTSIVSSWLTNPATNFGFSIRGDESLALSAKYFSGLYDITAPQLVVTTISGGAVPEPTTVALLLIGSSAFALRRRR